MSIGKKFWRCHVCNDIHLGVSGPEICPTCMPVNAFVESDVHEALKIIDGDLASGQRRRYS